MPRAEARMASSLSPRSAGISYISVDVPQALWSFGLSRRDAQKAAMEKLIASIGAVIPESMAQHQVLSDPFLCKRSLARCN